MQIFKTSGCFVCHGERGGGGAGPGFRGDPFLAITDYVMAQILLGRTIMPAYSEALSNDQIAAVASYIRNSWGNHSARSSRNRVGTLRNKFEATSVTAMDPPPPLPNRRNRRDRPPRLHFQTPARSVLPTPIGQDMLRRPSAGVRQGEQDARSCDRVDRPHTDR
jgi:Cytochrome C oxidase, cbb3-type, subunit III